MTGIAIISPTVHLIQETGTVIQMFLSDILFVVIKQVNYLKAMHEEIHSFHRLGQQNLLE